MFLLYFYFSYLETIQNMKKGVIILLIKKIMVANCKMSKFKSFSGDRIRWKKPHQAVPRAYSGLCTRDLLLVMVGIRPQSVMCKSRSILFCIFWVTYGSPQNALGSVLRDYFWSVLLPFSFFSSSSKFIFVAPRHSF